MVKSGRECKLSSDPTGDTASPDCCGYGLAPLLSFDNLD